MRVLRGRGRPIREPYNAPVALVIRTELSKHRLPLEEQAKRMRGYIDNALS